MNLIQIELFLKELATNINFLGINLKINNKLHFHVYHKPTKSFSYFCYKCFHLSHTNFNIALSLTRSIM